MEILKGAPVASAIKKELAQQVSEMKEAPCLAIVRVGNKPEDMSYERGAMKRMDGIGIKTASFVYPEDISMEAFLCEFKKINEDPSIDGILLFRPLPKQLDERMIVNIIRPEKDVDGISPANMAKVFMNDESGYAPCTAEAVIEILKHYNIPVSGRNAVIAGRSLVVGKPLSMLMLKENATVTVCHSRTENMPEICSGADILIAAIGRAKMLDRKYAGSDSVVIDVGINTDAQGALCGDVDFEDIADKASMATPVPGGVGAVTTSVLAKHVVKAAKNKKMG